VEWWLDYNSAKFLEPYGIPKNSLFTFDDSSLSRILSDSPSLKPHKGRFRKHSDPDALPYGPSCCPSFCFLFLF
jgi:hypothetical protein